MQCSANYLNEKVRRVPACPSSLNMPAISDRMFLACHALHSIHNSPVCRWVSIHACCALIAACTMTCTKHHTSQRLCPWIKCHIQAPTKPNKRIGNSRTQKSTLYHSTLIKQTRQYHTKHPSKSRSGDQHKRLPRLSHILPIGIAEWLLSEQDILQFETHFIIFEALR